MLVFILRLLYHLHYVTNMMFAVRVIGSPVPHFWMHDQYTAFSHNYVRQKYVIWDAPPDPLIWFVLQTLQQHQMKICNEYTWNNLPLSPTVNVSRLPSSAAKEKALIPKSSLAGKPTTWKSSLTLRRSTGGAAGGKLGIRKPSRGGEYLKRVICLRNNEAISCVCF